MKRGQASITDFFAKRKDVGHTKVERSSQDAIEQKAKELRDIGQTDQTDQTDQTEASKVKTEVTEETKADHITQETSVKDEIKTQTTKEVTDAKVDGSETTVDTKVNGSGAKNCADPHVLSWDKDAWVASLTPEQRVLLDLEIKHLHISWLAYLYKELTKPYFLKLKQFLLSEFRNKTIFPSPENIYSWSHYTPLPQAKVLIMGQDPYHNYNQAHGLAFSVLEPTKPPPSLLNIYKLLAIEYPDFVSPAPKKPGNHGGGNLTEWARRGVLMLNACLTVEAHKANSHQGRGWEQFTEQIIRVALEYHSKDGLVIMAWGSPAQKRISGFGALLKSPKVKVIRSVHPSPLSASRGFFESRAFTQCNEWLRGVGRGEIDWSLS